MDGLVFESQKSVCCSPEMLDSRVHSYSTRPCTWPWNRVFKSLVLSLLRVAFNGFLFFCTSTMEVVVVVVIVLPIGTRPRGRTIAFPMDCNTRARSINGFDCATVARVQLLSTCLRFGSPIVRPKRETPHSRVQISCTYHGTSTFWSADYGLSLYIHLEVVVVVPARAIDGTTT